MIDIIPAVLPKNFEELEYMLHRLKGVAPWVQIDLVGANVLDGHEALPLWDEFDFEFDVMLADPAAEIESVLALGPTRVVIHADAPTARQALEALQEYRGGDFPVECGVALAAHDEPQALEPFAGLFDYVQIMGIDRIGSQGQPADPHHRELALLKALRAAHPEYMLQVDGAAASHPSELADAGANRLVVGGAIVNAEDPRAAYKALYNLVNGS